VIRRTRRHALLVGGRRLDPRPRPGATAGGAPRSDPRCGSRVSRKQKKQNATRLLARRKGRNRHGRTVGAPAASHGRAGGTGPVNRRIVLPIGGGVPRRGKNPGQQLVVFRVESNGNFLIPRGRKCTFPRRLGAGLARLVAFRDREEPRDGRGNRLEKRALHLLPVAPRRPPILQGVFAAFRRRSP